MPVGNQQVWDKGIGEPATNMLMQSVQQQSGPSGFNRMALSGPNNAPTSQASAEPTSELSQGAFTTGDTLTFQQGRQEDNKNYEHNLNELLRRIAEAEASGDMQTATNLKMQRDFYLRGMASVNPLRRGGTLPGQGIKI